MAIQTQRVKIKQIDLLEEYQNQPEALRDLTKHIHREVNKKLDHVESDKIDVNYYYPIALPAKASVNYRRVVAANNQQQLTIDHNPQTLQDAYQFYQLPISDHFDRDLRVSFPLLDIKQLTSDTLRMYVNEDDDYDYGAGLVSSKALEIKLPRKRLIQGSIIVAAGVISESVFTFVKINYQINPMSLTHIDLWVNQEDAIASIISTDLNEFGYTNLDDEQKNHIDCVASAIIDTLTQSKRFSLAIKKSCY